tara:strand:+ start:1325 stop:1696 length:372 start_codon:yes stop_codon:yes gene_type:complete
MGLDQYGSKVRTEYDSDTRTTTITKTEIAYWRKHNALQGWMEQRWRDKGGTGVFNCENLVLTSEDLDGLELAVRAQELPETTGCFFGPDSREDEDERHADLKFIEDAREALDEGYEIEYSSWW